MNHNSDVTDYRAIGNCHGCNKPVTSEDNFVEVPDHVLWHVECAPPFESAELTGGKLQEGDILIAGHLVAALSSQRVSYKRHTLPTVLQGVVDAMAVSGALAVVYWLRFESDIAPFYSSRAIGTYALMPLITVLTTVGVLYLSEKYARREVTTFVSKFYNLLAAVSLAVLSAVAINSVLLGDQFIYSPIILIVGWLLCNAFVIVGRLLVSQAVSVLRRSGNSRLVNLMPDKFS